MTELVTGRAGSESEGKARELSERGQARIQALLKRYPTKRAALLPALWTIQMEFGWVSKEAVESVARTLDLSPAYVDGVVSFYTMYHRAPVGRVLIQVCTSISCFLCGSGDLLSLVERTLGIRPGETTPDGVFTLHEVECIAACDGGPAMLFGEECVRNVDEARFDALVADCRAAAPGRREG